MGRSLPAGQKVHRAVAPTHWAWHSTQAALSPESIHLLKSNSNTSFYKKFYCGKTCRTLTIERCLKQLNVHTSVVRYGNHSRLPPISTDFPSSRLESPHDLSNSIPTPKGVSHLPGYTPRGPLMTTIPLYRLSNLMGDRIWYKWTYRGHVFFFF